MTASTSRAIFTRNSSQMRRGLECSSAASSRSSPCSPSIHFRIDSNNPISALVLGLWSLVFLGSLNFELCLFYGRGEPRGKVLCTKYKEPSTKFKDQRPKSQDQRPVLIKS